MAAWELVSSGCAGTARRQRPRLARHAATGSPPSSPRRCWPALALFLRRFTDTDVPWSDGFVTALGVVGQVLLARKFIENWGVWRNGQPRQRRPFRAQGAVADRGVVRRVRRAQRRRLCRLAPASAHGGGAEPFERHDPRLPAGCVIAVLGAESTGKARRWPALARLQARDIGASLVGEYLREWCDREGRTPRPDEQAGIAEEQTHRIAVAAAGGIAVAEIPRP